MKPSFFLFFIICFSYSGLVLGVGDPMSRFNLSEATGEAAVVTIAERTPAAHASEVSVYISNSVGKCDELCRFDTTADFLEFNSLSLFISQNNPQSEMSFSDACTCLDNKLNTVGPAVSESERKREKDFLSTKMREDFSKFIVNNLASHIEDVSFFIHNRLGSFANVSENERKEIQCLSPNKIEELMRTEDYCGRRITNQHKAKIRELFKEFGDSTDLGTNLDRLNERVMDSGILKNGRLYTRHDFDFERQSLMEEVSAEFLTASQLLENVLKNETIASQVFAHSSRENVFPYEALSEVLVASLKNGDNSLLSRIFPAEILAKIKTGGVIVETKLRAELLKNYSELLNHPVSKRMLSDSRMFQNSQAWLRSTSLSDLMKGPTSIKEEFTHSCETVKSQIASYICHDNSKLMSNVLPDEFRNLVTRNLSEGGSAEDQRSNLIRSKLACEQTSVTGSISRELATRLDLTSVLPSDLFSRIANKDNNFVKFATRDSSSPIGLAVARATESYGRNFPDAAPERYREVIAQSKQIQVDNEVARSEKIESALNSNLPSADGVSQMNYQTAGPETENMRATSKDESTSGRFTGIDPRRELAEFLNGADNPEEVERLMSGTSDEMMKELMKLREEMDKNQQKINELLTENQRLKTDEMRRKLEGLERERAALDPGPVRTRSEASVSRDLPASVPTPFNRSVSAPVETGGSSSGNLSASTSGSSDGASLSGLNRALLSSSGGISRGPASDTSDPIVVSASGARSGSLEIRSQEVGLDLLNYLSNNGSDIQTLINLKTSGVLYRYQVLENGLMVEREVLIEYTNLNDDVKRIIDQKIAQNTDRAGEVLRLEREIQELRRTYSYTALQTILAEQMRGRGR